MPGETHPLEALNHRVVACVKCQRLVAWREAVAREKRAAFRDEEYWGRPVPSFGDSNARILIVGLAPAAHGANRTGRMFTGDRSGEWLFRALHRAGFADRASYRSADDGLALQDAWLSAAVRCAPPDNRPRPEERRACQPYLEEEMSILLSQLRGVVALGSFAWDQVLRVASDLGIEVPQPRPRFGHGEEVALLPEPGLDRIPGAAPLQPPLVVLGSYHPSQQNTFTGRLTESMFDQIWSRAADLARRPGDAVAPRRPSR